MISVRRSEDRGHFNHGWLDTRHTFSFADYRDPRFMGFRDLRVLNEDRIRPGEGFGTHGHRDMEIITYVLEGALDHADSTGNASTVRPGDVQRMSAGTGVLHSEYNHSREEPVHLLQIWVRPDRQGLPPSYEQRRYPPEEKRGRLRLVVSPDGAEDSVTIHQDVRLYIALLGEQDGVAHGLVPGRHAWVQVTRGEVDVNGKRLRAADGAAISGESEIRLAAAGGAEALVFDLP